MVARILLLCGFFALAHIAHGAPSSKEVDIVFVPAPPPRYPPIVIFEFKESDSDSSSDESGSNETSTTPEPETTTTRLPTHLSHKETDFPTRDSHTQKGQRSDDESQRSRRDTSKNEHLKSSPSEEDDHKDDTNSTVKGLGLNSDEPEVIFASSENDNGVVFTRISIFKLVRIPYDNSSESLEDNDSSTTANPEDVTPRAEERKKRDAGGYGASEAEPSGRALQAESLTSNTTAPTFVEFPPASATASAGVPPPPASAPSPTSTSAPSPAATTGAPSQSAAPPAAPSTGAPSPSAVPPPAPTTGAPSNPAPPSGPAPSPSQAGATSAPASPPAVLSPESLVQTPPPLVCAPAPPAVPSIPSSAGTTQAPAPPIAISASASTSPPVEQAKSGPNGYN